MLEKNIQGTRMLHCLFQLLYNVLPVKERKRLNLLKIGDLFIQSKPAILQVFLFLRNELLFLKKIKNVRFHRFWNCPKTIQQDE